MKSSLTFLACLFSLISYTQSVTGQLLSETQEPVPFANVLLFSSADSTLSTTALTDTSGSFSLKLPSDTATYYLLVQTMGKSDFISEPFYGEKHFGPVAMKDAAVELEAANIVTKKPMIENTGRGLVMNVSGSPILETSNGKEILEKIPGASLNQDGSISLKGKQNVKIFMDGKPTNMSMDDLMRLLENMPASEIEKVEVFEIPPAKYDASGSAGVINIVTKKGMRMGLNGSAGVRAGYGNFHKLSPNLRLNYRKKKFNVFGSGWYYNSKFDYKSTADMIMKIDGSESSFFNEFHKVHHAIGYGTRAGIDYFINDKTTIGYLAVLYNGATNGWEPSSVKILGPASNNYDYVDAIENFKYYWSGQIHNVNFKRQIKDGESLNLDMDFALKTGGNDNSNLNDYLLNDIPLTPYYIEQRGVTNTTFAVAKLDYEKTIFNSWALEVGAKSSWVKTENDFESFNGTNDQNIIENLGASNYFEYEEVISSAYGVLAKKWGDHWAFDAGTRLEYTDATGVSPTTGTTFNNSYLNVFPNVSVAYSVAKKYSLTTAYTRRIDRPKYHQLNPFQSQTNQFNFHQGNPELQPQISDVATITYSLLDAFYFTLSGSQMKGLMNQVIKQEEDLQRQVQITENLDKFENYSINAFIPFKIKKWYSGNVNATAYYNKMSSDLEWGFVGYEIFTFSVKTLHTFSLPKDFKIEISGFYKHDSYWNIWFVEPHYQIDAGLTKKYKSFRFNIAVKDFLNIREGNGGVFQNSVNMVTTYKPESRKVMLSINYKFGNKKVKDARRRSTGSEDVQNRSGK
ncbi:MAG: hypothetical protein ACJAZ2_002296 [Glaciecola sp.]|jgi:hypothetical protein